MRKTKTLRIVEESVIDHLGNSIGNRPEDFPALSNSIKVISATIKTGQDYRLVNVSDRKIG
ncbi:hypothetical protein [Paenibacillus elgii]|uniref:hypothetical protein n=1 Tax=Paenibacillus elgii TaxID=189691 RepID=UPI002040AEE7|nr:hypothetical protein [Paenibacillus elgii]MCM3273688.1 hypothetical protein [Paenibacillus elgii]